MIKKILTPLLLFNSILFAQQKASFSLQEAIEYSLKNSPSYLNADLDQKNAVFRKNEITGLGLPQVSGSIDLKDYISLPTSLIPAQFFGGPAGSFAPVKFGTKYNATAGFSASQLIFSSDYIIGLSAAKEYINLSKISVTRTKVDLTAQVSKAYYNVIINNQRKALLDANVARLKKIFEDTKIMNAQGFVEKIDVERIEVQYNNLITEQDKTGKLITLSENMLKFQMGYKISDEIALTDSLNINVEDQSILNPSKIDVSKRPDYQLLTAQQKLNELDVKRLKMGYLPTLAGYGSYQYNAQRQKFDFENTPQQPWFKIALIGATLNLNIFDGLQRHNQIQQAQITSKKMQNTIRNLEMSAELEASSASILYANAYSTMLYQKRNRELANHVYTVAQKKYEQGVGSNIELITAETSLKEADTNYLNSIFDMLVAKIDYQKATGTLIK